MPTLFIRTPHINNKEYYLHSFILLLREIYYNIHTIQSPNNSFMEDPLREILYKVVAEGDSTAHAGGVSDRRERFITLYTIRDLLYT